jgi:hypothetical protein
MSEAALNLTPSTPAQSGALIPHESAALLFRVPDDELQSFWDDLTSEQQAFVNETFLAIEEIHQARNRKAKAQEIADRCLGRDGFSWKTLLNKHRLYIAGGYKSGVKRAENYVRAGDWRGLVPDYWLPEKKYHPGFLNFLALLVGTAQRDQGDAAAIRSLKLEIWPAGEQSIPGYGTWRDEHKRRFPGEDLPAYCPPDFWPAGWSDRQLYRLLPDAAHLTEVRHGVAAAEEHFAQIMNDRAKLHFGQIIIIDDFWAPFKVAYNRGISYCIGLAAMDWASGAWLHHAIMPREELPDGTRKSLTASHMRWFIIGLLRILRGLPRDRTITLLVENNTASVTREVEEVIKQTFNGRVIIKRSGLLNDSQGYVLEHGFREGGGKWRAEGKGLIESGFNLVKNEMSLLPGQRGSKERTNGHAASGDMERYAVALLQNEALTAEHVALLKLPYLRYADAIEIVRRIFQRINDSRDHRCRGFLQVEEWRLSEKDQWTLYGSMPTPEQQALIDQGAEILRRTKPESRAMRARRLHAELHWTTIPESAYIPLAADHLKPVTVTAKKQIVLNRKGADALVFFSKHAFEEGLLVPGKEYRGFFYDEDPDAIHLTPVDSLKYLGSVARWRAVDPTDEEARSDAYKHTMAPKRATLSAIREAHAPQEAALAALRAHNDDVRLAAATGQQFVSGAAQARVVQQQRTASQVRAQKKNNHTLAERARRAQALQNDL